MVVWMVKATTWSYPGSLVGARSTQSLCRGCGSPPSSSSCSVRRGHRERTHVDVEPLAAGGVHNVDLNEPELRHGQVRLGRL